MLWYKMVWLQMFLYLVLSGVTLASGNDCDKKGILIYEDLGCTAEYGEDRQCPKKFSCKGLEPSSTNCYFRGKSYENRENVDSKLSYPSCEIACFCSTENGGPGFTCAVLDCPEWLGTPITSGCYRNYTLDECCSVGEICPPFDDIEKCVVEGKEYREGEKFYPSNTCLDCVCLKGFNGTFEEPFCRRRPCAQQLRSSAKIQQSCAAFYNNKPDEVLCCPNDWICSDGSETIEGDGTSEETCKFGEKTLKIGQHFEKLNFTDAYGRNYGKVGCECVIPPLTKCTKVT